MTDRVGVIGLGLIGGSVARTLLAQGVDVCGYSPSIHTRVEAAAAGIRCASSVADLGHELPDVVVLAVPLRVMRSVVAEVARYMPAAVLTDVGSVKGAVRDAVTAAGVAPRYVGAHPMAGTEHSGFAASSADLLPGAPWALTVDESTDPEAFLRVLNLVRGPLGGVARVLSDDVHDEAVALASHVPHVLATELLNLVVDAPVQAVALGLAAGSYRDGTRVARTDPRRTEAMVTDNAEWVASAVRVIIRDLERFADNLESNASVSDFFDRADEVRSLLGGLMPVLSSTSQNSAPTAGPVTIRLDRPGWATSLVVEGARGARVVATDHVTRTVTVAR